MINYNKPTFVIKKNLQKSIDTNIYFDSIATKSVLDAICSYLLGTLNYDYNYVDNSYHDDCLDATYNKGRLVVLYYQDTAYFISLSDEKCDGRNSAVQSVPTAFNYYYKCSYPKKRLYFFFVPCSGNNATDYHMFIYRLMATAGFHFINLPTKTSAGIQPFMSIDDIMNSRKANNRNPHNNSTYINKISSNRYDIYGKTYGANKYETALFCYAISNIAPLCVDIKLLECNEKDLKELPASCLSVIRSMNKITVENIDYELTQPISTEEREKLRSHKFNFNLFQKTGYKRCELCGCEIPEIIQAAHIWPVAKIKASRLSDQDKFVHAISGDNGVWMCQNHHKLFDSDILLLDSNGQFFVDPNKVKTPNDIAFIQKTTENYFLAAASVNSNIASYIARRYTP